MAGATSRFDAPYAPPDEALAAVLLGEAGHDAAAEARIDARATRLIAAIRARPQGLVGHLADLGGMEDFLREYALSTKEGLAMMVLAEALLRVPDSATADALIEDKLGQADWSHHETRSEALLVSASAWALGLTARVIHPGETPEGLVAALAKRLGKPAVRGATRQAMRLLGAHFVLGETIAAALKRAGSGEARLYRYSFDMLGEGARTAADAQRYAQSYADAITAIGRAAGNATLPDRPGISVKLSALHPRYEALSQARVMAELVPRVLALARQARAHDLNFTIDAEEADRLELSLDIVDALAADGSFAGWDGFGLTVQAYQKRALAVIGHLDALAARLNRRFMVRLVKGAYWDTEIKRAQERGLPDYPVFTRKAMTDLNYMACAGKLLAARPRLYPQFATHNALSIAGIVEMAGGTEGYEFQRLHGMGEDAYRALLAELPGAACRTYAPVGGHRDLLAYLVRRLLENGASSSFVSQAADPAIPIEDLLTRPQAIVGSPAEARNRHIPLPPLLYEPARQNSPGFELGCRATREALMADIAAAAHEAEAAPLAGGKILRPSSDEAVRPVRSPIDGARIGAVREAGDAAIAAALDNATKGFRDWDARGPFARADVLDEIAKAYENDRTALLFLLQREGGKTIDDAIAEWREAIDFCRYYASEARKTLAPRAMPGPTGEDNGLVCRGRGAFLCISPWNFPLAIFTGQIVAALVAGNSAIAKPAEQTPLIAARAVRLMLEAGVPAETLALMPGDGAVGAKLVADPRIAGVAFTGSTEVAAAINRALAGKDGPIVPLIAETGGINAMIVDATALPEQVSDDVIASAFRSAGQRCSALRLLCVQEDIADPMIEMIAGAAAELRIGDPRDGAVQIGPVIDAEARDRLLAHAARMGREAETLYAGRLPEDVAAQGTFVPPYLFGLQNVRDLKAEIFGPILHVVRWRADDLPRLLDEIATTGYGLTLGIHSRIDATVARIVARLNTGNVYVNRNMIGAVVGTQPFGGSGLSGTGPKAGGPHYLSRFALEQTVSINTAAAGGNAALLAGGA